MIVHNGFVISPFLKHDLAVLISPIMMIDFRINGQDHDAPADVEALSLKDWGVLYGP